MHRHSTSVALGLIAVVMGAGPAGPPDDESRQAQPPARGDVAFLQGLIDASATLEPATSGAGDEPAPAGKLWEVTIEADLQRLGAEAVADALAKAQGLGKATLERTIDMDADGRPELRIESRPWRGPLSTYGSTTSAVALPHCTILRGGRPLDSGERLTSADLRRAAPAVTLFRSGGSLRYPDRPKSDFSGGTWYRQRAKALAVLVRTGERVGIGRVVMSVTARGTLIVHDVGITWFDGFQVEFEVDPADIPPLDPMEIERKDLIDLIDLPRLDVMIPDGG